MGVSCTKSAVAGSAWAKRMARVRMAMHGKRKRLLPNMFHLQFRKRLDQFDLFVHPYLRRKRPNHNKCGQDFSAARQGIVGNDFLDRH
jgi:hypothetical protein